MKKFIPFILALLCGIQVTAQATGDYQSAAAGNWSAASTWQIFNGISFITASVPPSASNGVITIRNGHNVNIDGAVTTDQTIVEAGGTLTQTATLTMADGTGDDVTVNGNYIFISGTINGAGLMKVNGNFEWRSGNLNTNIILATGATGSKTTIGNAGINSSFGNPVFTNNGNFTWANGNFDMNYGSISNGATGVFTAIGNNQMTFSGGNHNFNNAGTFTKNAGSGVTAINVNGSNTGTISVDAGTISSGASFTNTNSINIAPGKTFLVNAGNFTLGTGSNSNGTGIFELSGGIITITSPIATPATAGNFLFSSGNINGAGTCSFKITNGMEWRTGSLHTNIELAAGSVNSKTTAGTAGINSSFGNPVFTNNGSLTWADGNFDMNYGSISNGAMGVFTATGNNQMTFSGGNHSFNNTGTFTKNTGSGVTAINVNGSNTGTISVDAGTISSGASFTNTNSINIAPGKTFLVNAGNFTLGTGSNSNGTGIFELSGGIITITSPIATPATAGNFLFSSGNINGAGTCSFKITNGMEWRTGSLHTNIELAAGSVNSKTTAGTAGINSSFGNPVFTNNGSLTWADGNFDMNYGSISNGAMGVFTATGNNQMTFSGGNHSFNNTGTFTKNTGSGVTAINVNGSNTGTISVDAGTISSGASFTNTNSINIAPGKTFLVNAGNFTLGTGSNSNGTGFFELSGGIITITSPIATPATAGYFLFSSGNINGAGTCSFKITGGMEWKTGSLHTNMELAAGSVNSKTTAGNAGINSSFGNPVFTNSGSLTWADGNFDMNYGSINNSSSGVITASGNNQITTSGGNHNFNNAGTFTKINATGATTFSVNANNTGRIKGVGIISGSFTNNGIIAPGNPIGILTVNSAQPLSSNSTLEIELQDGNGAGSGHDQLSRSGSLTLAGNLVVTETGTVPNGTYTIINVSGSISGSFANVVLPSCYTLQVNASSVTVTRNRPVTPTITAGGPTTFCQGGNVTLTSGSVTGNIWSNGATTQSITVNASGNFTVMVSNLTGCFSLTSTPEIITVNPLPTAPTISAGGSRTFCQGGNVVLTSSATTGNLWNDGETTQSITVSTTGFFTVTATNENGCTSPESAAQSITVNPLPAAPIITANGPTTFCQGGNVILTSSAATGNTWSNGATTQSITVTTNGTFSVATTDVNGCASASSSPITITVNPSPVSPTISANGPTIFCQGGTVILTSSVATGNLWSNGGVTQSVIVNGNGDYSVSFTDANGCSATSTVTTVIVNPLPDIPTITAFGPIAFCEGGSVTLVSNNIYSTVWSNDQVGPSIIVYTTDHLTVTVTNSFGCSATSLETVVTVNPLPPVPAITANASTGLCPGATVTLTSSSVLGNLWNHGETSQSIDVDYGGIFSVSVTDQNGCIATSSPISTTQFPAPSIPIISANSPTAFCEGGSVTLTTFGPANDSYLWSNGAATQSMIATTGDDYTVTATNGNGCSTTSQPFVVTVYPLPFTPTINLASPTSTICEGGTVNIFSSFGSGYLWSNGATTQAVFASTSGTYNVIVTNGHNCYSPVSNSITVTVNPTLIPSVSIVASAISICGGTAVIFTATPVNGGINPMYRWTQNGIVVGTNSNIYSSNISINNTAVICELTSSETCILYNYVQSNTIIIAVNPSVVVGAVSGNPFIPAGTSSLYTAAGQPGGTWSSSNTSVAPINATTGLVTALSSGNTTITYTVSTGCNAPLSSSLALTVTGPVVAISGPTLICATGNTYQYTISGGATGGTWTSSNTLVAQINPTTGVVTPLNAGPFTVNYSNNNVSAVSLTVTVHAFGIIGGISGPTNVCGSIGNGTILTYSVQRVAGSSTNTLSWYFPGGVITGFQNQSSTIQIRIDAVSSNRRIFLFIGDACGASTTVYLDLLYQAPNTPGTITAGANDICASIGTGAQPITYKINKVPGASRYDWVVPTGMLINHPNPPGINDTIINATFHDIFASGQLRVSATNPCGTSSLRSLNIARAIPATPGLINGPTNACAYMLPQGIMAVYSVTAVSGVTFHWNLPTGATGITGQGTNIISFYYPAGFILDELSVTATNGCGTSAARTLSVTVLKPATPGVIDVIQLQGCPNRRYSYTLASIPSNAVSLLWNVPPGAVLVSGQGTTSIIVTYPPGSVKSVVGVTATANCRNSTQRTVNVKLSACPPLFTARFAEAPPPNPVANTIMIPVNENLSTEIFPNPSTNVFNLKVNTSEKETIQVKLMDVTGRLIKEFVVQPYQTINMGAELKAGLYMIEVKQGENTRVTRIVKY